MDSTLERAFLACGVGVAEFRALRARRAEDETCLRDDLERVKQGYPIQYLIGSAAFLDEEFYVDEGVLIPRPETETWFSVWLDQNRSFLSNARRGLEIGLGSGVLSLTLLKLYPSLEMVATEVSEDARMIAEQNRSKILRDPERLRVMVPEGPHVIFPDTLETGSFDFLVSNPPYLSVSDPVQVPGHEPRLALFAEGDDPLRFYEAFGAKGWEYLCPGGRLVCEISEFKVSEIFAKLDRHPWKNVTEIRDLRGRVRAFSATRGA